MMETLNQEMDAVTAASLKPGTCAPIQNAARLIVSGRLVLRSVGMDSHSVQKWRWWISVMMATPLPATGALSHARLNVDTSAMVDWQMLLIRAQQAAATRSRLMMRRATTATPSMVTVAAAPVQ